MDYDDLMKKYQWLRLLVIAVLYTKDSARIDELNAAVNKGIVSQIAFDYLKQKNYC